MRLIFVVLLFCLSTPVYAESVVFWINDIENLKLVSGNDIYKLSEYCTIKNRNGQNISLSEIKLPTMARGNYELDGDGKVLTWVTITGAKNNNVIPE